MWTDSDWHLMLIFTLKNISFLFSTSKLKKIETQSTWNFKQNTPIEMWTVMNVGRYHYFHWNIVFLSSKSQTKKIYEILLNIRYATLTIHWIQKKNRWLKTTTFSLLKIVMENVWTKRLRIKDQRSKSGIYLFKYYLKISIHTVALHEQNTDKVVLLPGSFLLAIFFWIKNRQVKSFLNYGRPHYYS